MLHRFPLITAYIYHYLAYIFMQTLALLAETRRGAALSDLLHRNIAEVAGLDIINNQFWFYGLLASIFLFSMRYRVLAINYLRIGAMVSIIRGVFIYVTTLGPSFAVIKRTPEVILNLTIKDISFELLMRQWLPIDLFFKPSHYSAVYLTQDLMFSGHTSSTFLFLLLFLKYYKRQNIKILESKLLLAWFFIYHIVVVLALVLSHEHYTIDILVAYFVVYACYQFSVNRDWLVFCEAPAASK